MEKQFVSVSDVWRKDVAIPEIVSAVEEKGVYYFDRFGRYKKADPASCLNGLEFLWGWKNDDNSGPAIDPETEEVLYDPSLQLDDFGWYEEDLPAFGENVGMPKVVPQQKRTENNLLKIIAALCERLDINWRKCSGSELVRITEFSGERILSDDTALKYLRMIRQVVD